MSDATASTLLPELLAKIFLHNKETLAYCPPPRRIQKHAKDIRNASQVCRNWRLAALSCPLLWVDTASFEKAINNSYEKWIQLTLERTKDVPIYASVAWPRLADDYDDQDPSYSFLVPEHFTEKDGWKRLFPNLHRVGKLSITIDHEEPSEALAYFSQQLRNYPAPRLRRLKIDFNKSYQTEESDLLTLTSPFLHPETANLEQVEFNSIRFTAEIARESLSNLHRLSVSFGRNVNRLSLIEWFGVLRELPKLESLSIMDMVPRGVNGSQIDSDSSATPSANVELPKLKNLSLARDLPDVGDLLSHLHFSPSANLGLSLYCRDTRLGEHYKALVKHLYQYHNYSTRSQTPSSVSIAEGEGKLELEVTLHTSPPDSLTIGSETDPHLSLELGYPSAVSFKPSDFDPPLTGWMHEHLSETDEVYFVPSDDDPPEHDVARELLEPFKKATRIYTSRFDLVLEAAGFIEGTDRPENPEVILLPHLDTIQMTPHRWTHKALPLSSELWSVTLDFVKSRQEGWESGLCSPICCFDAIPPVPGRKLEKLMRWTWGEEEEEEEDEEQEAADPDADGEGKAEAEKYKRDCKAFCDFCESLRGMGVYVCNSSVDTQDEIDRGREEARKRLGVLV